MKIFNFKFTVVCVIFFTSTFTMNAQLFMKKDEVIKDEGYNYELKTTEDDIEYIMYEKELETDRSGKYTRFKAIYFMEMDDGTKVCNKWKIFEPSSETNSNVSYFKKQGYVDVDYMQWKDYENNVVYDISVKDGLCIITVVYDESK